VSTLILNRGKSQSRCSRSGSVGGLPLILAGKVRRENLTPRRTSGGNMSKLGDNSSSRIVVWQTRILENDRSGMFASVSKDPVKCATCMATVTSVECELAMASRCASSASSLRSSRTREVKQGSSSGRSWQVSTSTTSSRLGRYLSHRQQQTNFDEHNESCKLGVGCTLCTELLKLL
jgi:hypothetical protein